MHALSVIWNESKKNRTTALMLAFMLGEIVGKHEERKAHKAASINKAKRTAYAMIDYMDEQSLMRILRFGFKIRQNGKSV